jgi:hypothetical protein
MAGAGQQLAGMGRDRRVVVHADDSRTWRDPLDDVVGVLIARQPGADVEELADAGLAGQEAHHAPAEQPRRLRHVPDPWIQRGELVTRHLVSLVVTRAAHPVVPDPRGHRYRIIVIHGAIIASLDGELAA